MSRIQISRETISCPFDSEAKFRDLRLLYWMPTPTTVSSRAVFVVLTPLYVVVCLLFAFTQMLFDLCLSANTWVRVIRGY